MNAHASAKLLPDHEILTAFFEALFRHADRDGFINLRSFMHKVKETDKEEAFFIEGVALSAPHLMARVADRATHTAQFSKPAVFAPPVCTFATPKSAAASNLANGLVIMAECDARPSQAHADLVPILGEPTLAVASGGRWVDPDTGELEDKLHLYWRLAAPTRTEEEHGKLYAARAIVQRIVGSDATSISIVHPLRWAGSVHTKAEHRLATIVRRTENEADLDDALARLRAACPEHGADGDHASASTAAGDLADLESALAVIPNDCDWERWNKVGMALWNATAGSDGGLKLFVAFSAKSSKHSDAATRERWSHYAKHPPSRIGAGSIFRWAKEADPTWMSPSFRRKLEEGAVRGGGNQLLITEDQAALEFAERYKGRLRYCHDHGAWFEWTGAIWKKNGTGLAFHFARELARQLAEDENAKTRVTAGKAAFAGAVEKFARNDQRLAVTAETWDRDPWLLGTPGGTVDLRTGLLRPANPSDGITKTTAVAPATTADCPLWLRFLDETTGGDGEMVRFMQLWCGYSLTGDTREHALVFVFGSGGNGKSVFVNVNVGIMADYATTASMDVFIASNADRHPTDLAMLRGARLVTASETEEGRQWAESRIKQLTGGDRISARFMRQDFFTYLPAFKLTIIGNHKPGLRNVDDAARRRFNLVPFTRKPEVPDRSLEEKLRAEWPGILRWMIDGCLAWQRGGLVRPESVTAATEAYFDDQDILGEWLEEKCVVEPGNQNRKETTQDLFASWSLYAKAANELPGTVRSFSQTIEKHGFAPIKSVPTFGGKRARGFAGITLRYEQQREAAE